MTILRITNDYIRAIDYIRTLNDYIRVMNDYINALCLYADIFSFCKNLDLKSIIMMTSPYLSSRN